MLKHVIITNEETKIVAVGIGGNVSFYEKAGMIKQDVEQAYDGNWYLAGFAPSKPISLIAQEERLKRDTLLLQSDWTQTVDAPLSAKEKSKWATYRQELRDITLQPDFPNNVVYPVKP